MSAPADAKALCVPEPVPDGASTVRAAVLVLVCKVGSIMTTRGTEGQDVNK